MALACQQKDDPQSRLFLLLEKFSTNNKLADIVRLLKSLPS
jgi:hypothetical protein